MNSFIVGLVVAGSCFRSVESLTVIVYDLHTLDSAGHGFDDVITQNVLFTSRRALTEDVGFKCRAI